MEFQQIENSEIDKNFKKHSSTTETHTKDKNLV